MVKYGVTLYGPRMGHQDTMHNFQKIGKARKFALKEMNLKIMPNATRAYIWDKDKPNIAIISCNKKRCIRLKKPKKMWG